MDFSVCWSLPIEQYECELSRLGVSIVRAFVGVANGVAIARVVVGEGLIGRSVSKRIRLRAHDAEMHRPTSWSSPTHGNDLAALLKGHEIGRVEILWTAGSFGMSSSADVDGVLSQFSNGLADIVSVAQTYGPTRVHLASSAGALGCVTADRRFETVESAYRQIKQGEEDRAQELVESVRIHRVTSVYGEPSVTGRAGMVGVLIGNGLRAKETALYARTVTMRNYIFADDVAEALVRATDDPSLDMTLLGARRSHAMHEVVATAQAVIRRKIPISYRPPANHHDMVFNPAAVSPLVPHRPLSAGMRTVFDALIST